jgi:hypothetical protein
VVGAHGPRPHRRDVLTVGAVGMTSLALPSAAAAASGDSLPLVETPPADTHSPDPDHALVLNGTTTTARTSGTTKVITTAAFTVELWILYDGGNKGSYRNFVNQYVSSTNRIYIGLDNTNANTLRFAWGGSTLRIVNFEQFQVPENEWFHVAMTRTSGGSVALYINGALISSPGATSTGVPNTYFQVGAIGTSEYVSGQVDQVKVWNSALTEAQVRRSMHAYSDSDGAGEIAATLAAHYDFNEGEGSTVSNRVGTSDTDLTVTAAAYSQDAIMTESVVGSDKVVTFTRTFLPSAGGWSVPPGVTSVRSLVVAGGGGGGSDEGGGGGAGGFIETLDQSVSGVVPVIVGQGGLGGYTTSASLDRRATSGQASSFGSTSKVTATGGGAGGDAADGANATATAANRRGLDGGSGGGAAGERVAAIGGAGTDPQGNGGASTLSTQDAGGGGGGAGGAATTRAGGDGRQSTISGVTPAPYYAAGGSGGLGNSATGTQPGTDSIGGVGGSSNGSATRGVVNTGSGGGGGSFLGSAQSGAGGGSGIIVIRYAFE